VPKRNLVALLYDATSFLAGQAEVNHGGSD